MQDFWVSVANCFDIEKKDYVGYIFKDHVHGYKLHFAQKNSEFAIGVEPPALKLAGMRKEQKLQSFM